MQKVLYRNYKKTSTAYVFSQNFTFLLETCRMLTAMQMAFAVLFAQLNDVYFRAATCFFNVRSARRIARIATGTANTMTVISIGMLSITGFIRSS